MWLWCYDVLRGIFRAMHCANGVPLSDALLGLPLPPVSAPHRLLAPERHGYSVLLGCDRNVRGTVRGV
jgi:hypothetical protein